MELASRVAVNTTLAAAAGGFTALLIDTVLGRPTDITNMLNGILSGGPNAFSRKHCLIPSLLSARMGWTRGDGQCASV
jgi:Ammonium Transporter Family